MKDDIRKEAFFMVKDMVEIEKWYRGNRPIYEKLCLKVKDIIVNALAEKGNIYPLVIYRPKGVAGYLDKASKDKYDDPIRQIKDMAGLRVITTITRDIPKAREILEGLFKIDFDNTVDKRTDLGQDKVGYNAIHYVATLTDDQCRPRPLEGFKDLPFEIQVMSLLQFTWAEVEHDRSYKNTGVDIDLQRSLNLVAGTLEIADKEFTRIAEDIDIQRKELREKLGKQDLDVNLDVIALEEYLDKRYSDLITRGLLIRDFSHDIGLMRVISEYGITKLSGLDNIVPPNLENNISDLNPQPKLNYSLLVRIVLLIHDARKYFESPHSNCLPIVTNYWRLLAKYQIKNAQLREPMEMYAARIRVELSELEERRKKLDAWHATPVKVGSPESTYSYIGNATGQLTHNLEESQRLLKEIP